MRQVLIIELDDHVPGSISGTLTSTIDGDMYLDFLNGKMGDEDKSYGHILVSGTGRGEVQVVRAYGTRVDRAEVEELLRD